MPQKFFFWRRWQWHSPVPIAEFATAVLEPSEEDMLAAVLSEPPGFERRAAIRHAVEMPTSCREIALLGGNPWPAVLRDVSATGVGLVLSEPLQPGTFLTVEVPRPSKSGLRRLPARVVDNRHLGDGSWLVGCRLVRPLHDDELAELVG